MTLELSLRRPFTLSRVFRAQSDSSQHDYHWVGQKQEPKQDSAAPGEHNNNPRNRKQQQKYRPLADLTLGEVEDTYKRFEHQLLPASENWIGRNYFCLL